jgi:class 3 adenylate cyclase
MPTELLIRAAHAARAEAESRQHAPSRRGEHPAPQPGRAGTRHIPTFVFADLAGYSALTDERGDEAATSLAREFHRAMRRLTRDHFGWTVKSMGDGVMLWVPDAGQAVALAARAVAEVGTRSDLLPVRVGVHTGQAVMSEGDWFGRAVNLAARLAREARPNEALVSAATRAAAGDELKRRLAVRRELVLPGLNRRVSAWRLT